MPTTQKFYFPLRGGSSWRIIENNAGRDLKESSSSSLLPQADFKYVHVLPSRCLPKSMRRWRFLPLWAGRAAAGWTWTELGLCLDRHLYPNHIHKLSTQEQSLPFLMDNLFQSLDGSSWGQISSCSSALVKNCWTLIMPVSVTGWTCKMVGSCKLQLCPCYAGFPCCSQWLNT